MGNPNVLFAIEGVVLFALALWVAFVLVKCPNDADLPRRGRKGTGAPVEPEG